jgi:alpha-methylacyl-CoA racemase
MSGPLVGVRVVELAGVGPGPHACMVLADLGADVLRVERPGGLDPLDLLNRGRRVVKADLKVDAGRELVLDLVERADVLVEGFRPGVTERLGLGPEDCRGRNPRLVYARMTGWGQHGRRAPRAGHDINYLAITGALDNIGTPGGPPVPPLNLVGDFGGGSMYLAVGILAALVERERSGCGDVIDAAIVDGVGSLIQMMWSLRSQGRWHSGRGGNLVDGSIPFYGVYECADGRFVSVGSIEPQFFALLLDGLGLDPVTTPGQWDEAHWDELRSVIADRFAQHDLAHWREVFDDTDACVAPVLGYEEALEEGHLLDRGSLVRYRGVDQAMPAPRFARSATRLNDVPAASITAEAAIEEWSR